MDRVSSLINGKPRLRVKIAESLGNELLVDTAASIVVVFFESYRHA